MKNPSSLAIDDIIENAVELREHCGQWKNGLIGCQYLTPFSAIIKHLPSHVEKRVLDWGCGDGHLSYFLCKNQYKVEAFSFDDLGSISSLLHEKFRKNFSFSKGCESEPVKIPYQDGTFDAVFSLGVLEHVRETGGNELGSLKELHRILKPGGLLCVFHFPNKFSWIEFVNRFAKRLGLTKKYVHNFLYRKNEIINFANQTNFEVIEIGIYNLFPRNLFRKFNPPKSVQKIIIFIFMLLENIFSFFLKEFSQNYYFVLKKREKGN